MFQRFIVRRKLDFLKSIKLEVGQKIIFLKLINVIGTSIPKKPFLKFD